MVRMKIFVQAHLQSPVILGGTHMAAKEGTAADRKQARPYQRTGLLRRTRTRDLPCSPMDEGKGIIPSSHPLMPSSPVVSLLSASSSNRHLVLSSWIGQRATFGTRSKLRCLRPLRYTTRPHSFVTAWFVESARLECVIFSLDRSKLTSTFWTGTSCDRARQTLREHSKIIPLVPVVGSPDARRQIGTRLSSVRPLQHASHVGDFSLEHVEAQLA